MSTFKEKWIATLKIWMGEEGYCRYYHSCYTHPTKKDYWYCPICNLSRIKLLSDDDTGPM